MNNPGGPGIRARVDFAIALVFVCASSVSCGGAKLAADAGGDTAQDDVADAVQDASTDAADDTVDDGATDVSADAAPDAVLDAVPDVLRDAVEDIFDVASDVTTDTAPDVPADVAVGLPEVEMVLIPADTFWMGCNSPTDIDCGEDESPYHQVALSAYYIDRTETTVAVYGACVAASVCSLPGTGESCGGNAAENADHPVTCVDWQQAVTFCGWLGKRLPTEAEWEVAARGTDGRIFPWGNETPTCELAVMADVVSSEYGCGTGGTWSVCSKSPAGDSPYGLCDMAGNVWEWVSDWFGADYYATSPTTDPAGPSEGSSRVTRGGSFPWTGGYMRVANRNGVEPSMYDGDIGFRCAKDAL